jgi:hypothetical protein
MMDIEKGWQQTDERINKLRDELLLGSRPMQGSIHPGIFARQKLNRKTDPVVIAVNEQLENQRESKKVEPSRKQF